MRIIFATQKNATKNFSLVLRIAAELAKNYNVVVANLDYQQKTTINIVKNLIDYKKVEVFSISNNRELIGFFHKYDNKNTIVIVVANINKCDFSLTNLSILLSDFIIMPYNLDFMNIQELKSFENLLKDISSSVNNHFMSYVLVNNIHLNQKKFSKLKNFIDVSKHFEIVNANNIINKGTANVIKKLTKVHLQHES